MSDQTTTQQDQDKARTAEVKRLEKVQRLKKKLRVIERRLGVGELFGMKSVITDDAKAKEQKVVIEALAMGIDVHRIVLGYHRLMPEKNPKVPSRFDGEEPF